MAFGSGAVLISDFTGSDENPISESGIWTNKIDSGGANMRRLANAAASSAASPVGAAWYNVQQYAATEVYYTVTTKPASGDYCRLFARVQQPGTAGPDGYMCQIEAAAGTDLIRLFRMDNAAFNQIGSTANIEWSANDKFGIEAIGSAIKVYRNSGSGWTEIISATDANYTSGFIGIGISNTTGRIDDFFGGAPVSSDIIVPRALGVSSLW